MNQTESRLVPSRIQRIEQDKIELAKIKIPTTFLSVSPYKRIVEMDSNTLNETVIQMSNDTYVQIYKYKSYDLNLLNVEEKRILIQQFANFLRIYSDDIKNVSLMFPVNTTEQQHYWMMKYENAKTQIQKELSAERLLRLKAIQTHFKTQTHYCYIFSNTVQEMEDKMRSIPQYHSLIDPKPLTREEKEQLLYRLNNQEPE